MDVSQLTLKLIILLIPGALSVIIYNKLTINTKKKEFAFFIANSIVFGCINYLLCEAIFGWIFNMDDFTGFWLKLKSDDIPFRAVAFASLFSLIIGLAGAKIDNFKVINRFAQKIRFTNKYGDENLFSYFLGLTDVNEVFIHDIEHNLTYNGTVRHYSETENFKEIVLENVNVYPYDHPELGISYSLQKLYLARAKDNLIIEVPFIYPENR